MRCILLLACWALAFAGPLGLLEELLNQVGHRLAEAITMSTNGFPAELADLAGMHGPNGERDLIRWSRKQMWRCLMPELYTFPLRFRNSNGVGNGGVML